MGDGAPSLSRGLLLTIGGVWILARTFKAGLADKLAHRVS